MQSNFYRSIVIGFVILLTAANAGVAQEYSVARQWSECQLNCIRKYFAKPTVHARHLAHLSIAMYDAWAIYDDNAQTQFLGQTWGNFNCPFNGIPMPADGNLLAAQEKAISYAAYRTLWNRYTIFAPGANLLTIQGYINTQMAALGYDPTITSTDYSDGDPAKLGNYIAAKLQEFALQDGSNQQNNYANQVYQPINGQLQPAFPGNPYVVDPNRWQSLVLASCFDQNNNEIECAPGSGTPALSHEWGNVIPFSLTQDQATIIQRDGSDWKVYLDPGAPPYLDTTVQTGLDDSFFKWGYVTNIIWHSFHNNDDGVMVDISPNEIGGLNFTNGDQLPTTFDDYKNFYDLYNGGVADPGYNVNPATGLPYETQMVPRKDFTRVLSQYWADGPNSETPPGHWFKMFNQVADHPQLVKRWMGEGEILSNLEWDIRGYLALGGGIHDAAIACWGAKGAYDYTRPIMAIRWMGSKGQSTDPNLPHYHPAGLPLIPGYIELVQSGDPLAGTFNEHVDKIKIYSWRGPVAATGTDGAGWLLAENWWTYQTSTFVTPPFAGYYSGHSTYSRTGAEIMTLMTGDPYFPGGMGEFTATQDSYLLADSGPSTTIKLQWATYRDASDQCSVSRIYGGLHPPQDDIPGRRVGLVVGPQAFERANALNNADPAQASIAINDLWITDADANTQWTITTTFDKAMNMDINPQLIFVNNAAASSFQFVSGIWTDATHFTATYTIIDSNVTINNVLISAQGAQDSNGVTNMPGVSQAFAIDTQNPMATANIIGAANVLNDSDAAAGASIDILLEFNENMDTATEPVFTVLDANATSSLVLNASSAWTGSTTYHAVLDLIDNNVEAMDIDLEVSAATDINGNSQLILMLNDAVSIDTQAPQNNFSASHSVVNDSNAGDLLSITLNYNEAMSASVNPQLTFTDLDLTGNLAFIDESWSDEHTYVAQYIVLDGNTEAASISLSASGVSDIHGNVQMESTLNNAFSIDTKNPMVATLASSNELLADTDAGNPFQIEITFDDAMDTATDPEIQFTTPIASLTANAGASFWVDNNTYSAAFEFADDNVELSNIVIEVSGSTDDAGNAQNVIHYNFNLFEIDSRNPQVVSLTPSTITVNSGDIGNSTFAITVDFDEAMDQNQAPALTLSGTASSYLSLSASSGWSSAYSFTARYDVANVDASVSNIGVTVSPAATDAAGNALESTGFDNVFNIDVVSGVNAIANAEGGWSVYPNPVVSGQMLNIISNDAFITGIAITDAMGRAIHQLTGTNTRSLMMNTATWSSGLYMVRLTTTKGAQVRQFMVID